MRWNLIKAAFSRRAKSLTHDPSRLDDSRRKHRESTIWQRRFGEHRIRDEEEYRIYLDYIRYNPVKHGWAQRVVDWPYSTFHRYVADGTYPKDWGGQKEGWAQAVSCPP